MAGAAAERSGARAPRPGWLRQHVFAPANEDAFQREIARRVMRQVRFGALFAFLLVLGQSLWELGAPDLPGPRTGALAGVKLVALAVMALLLMRRMPPRPRLKPEIYAHLIVLAWLAILVQSILFGSSAAPPAALFLRLWPSFLLVEFFIFALVALQFSHALLAGGLVLLAAAGCGLAAGVPGVELVSILYYLTAILLVGLFQVLRIERSDRRIYLLRRRAAHHVRLARDQRRMARGAQEEADGQRRLVESALALVETERVKALDAAALKERFFSAAYHDMQQPLSTINLFARALSRRLVGPTMDAARRDLGVIERATAEIGVMFKGVREIWELGHYEPHIEVVDLSEVIEELAAQAMAAARDKGLVLRVYRRNRPPCWVRSDRMLLKRAVGNLLQNAIKYTRAGGVLLGFVRMPGRVRIDVCDTGIGIPAAYSSRIFEEYFQVPADGRDHPGGLGLGLSIVQRIEAALPGHQLELASVPERGTRFSLVVPPEQPLSAESPPSPPPPGDSSSLRGKYIVVVENDVTLLGGMIATLADAGCYTQGAVSHAQAGEVFEESTRSPDLLITDYRLDEGWTGLDVIALMEETLEWAGPIPVMLVTGDLLSEATARRLPPGSVLYRKPIDPATLLVQIAELLAVHSSASSLAGSLDEGVPRA